MSLIFPFFCCEVSCLDGLLIFDGGIVILSTKESASLHILGLYNGLVCLFGIWMGLSCEDGAIYDSEIESIWMDRGTRNSKH